MQLSAVVEQLRKIAGRDAVLDRPEDLMLYEYDGGIRKSTPGAVVEIHEVTELEGTLLLKTCTCAMPPVTP